MEGETSTELFAVGDGTGAEALPPIVTTSTREAFLCGARWRLQGGIAVGALAAAGAAGLAVWAAVAVTAS